MLCVWLLLSGFRDCRFNFLAHKYLSHISYDFLFVNFKLLLCWDTPVYPASDGAKWATVIQAARIRLVLKLFHVLLWLQQSKTAISDLSYWVVHHFMRNQCSCVWPHRNSCNVFKVVAGWFLPSVWYLTFCCTAQCCCNSHWPPLDVSKAVPDFYERIVLRAF